MGWCRSLTASCRCDVGVCPIPTAHCLHDTSCLIGGGELGHERSLRHAEQRRSRIIAFGLSEGQRGQALGPGAQDAGQAARHQVGVDRVRRTQAEGRAHGRGLSGPSRRLSARPKNGRYKRSGVPSCAGHCQQQEEHRPPGQQPVPGRLSAPSNSRPAQQSRAAREHDDRRPVRQYGGQRPEGVRPRAEPISGTRSRSLGRPESLSSARNAPTAPTEMPPGRSEEQVRHLSPVAELLHEDETCRPAASHGWRPPAIRFWFPRRAACRAARVQPHSQRNHSSR